MIGNTKDDIELASFRQVYIVLLPLLNEELNLMEIY